MRPDDAGRAGRIRRAWGALVVGLLAVTVPVIAQSQTPGPPSPPLTARLILKNPPPGVAYDATSPASPVTIVLQIENTSGFPITTTDGFSKTEFWRRLFFTDPTGGVIINTAEAGVHGDTPVSFCFSRQGVLQRPSAIPVTPVEELAGPPASPFFLEYVIDDARRFYDLTRPGRYTVDARIPLQTFLTSDASAVIRDCDQFRGRTVVNVNAVSGRQQFTILSNALEFMIVTDQIPPELTARCAPAAGSPVVAGRDDGGAGIDSVARTGSVPIRRGEFKSQETFLIRDGAGNRLEATFAVKAEGGESRFRLLTLAYNGGQPSPVEENLVKCEASRGRDGVRELNQRLELPAQGIDVRAKFDAKKNETEIRIRRAGTDQRLTRSGLVFLLLTTRQGQLGFEL